MNSDRYYKSKIFLNTSFVLLKSFSTNPPDSVNELSKNIVYYSIRKCSIKTFEIPKLFFEDLFQVSWNAIGYKYTKDDLKYMTMDFGCYLSQRRKNMNLGSFPKNCYFNTYNNKNYEVNFIFIFF